MLSTWRTAAVNMSGGQPLLNGFLIDGAANDKIGDAAGAMTYLAVDATQVYWASNFDGTVYAAPKGGGNAAPLASGYGQPYGVATDGASAKTRR